MAAKRIEEFFADDRPREKLIIKGPQALKSHELAALLLGSGTKNKDVLSLAREVIKLFDDDFQNITVQQLTTIHGLGKAKAAQLLAAVELSRRYLIRQHKKISTALDVYHELKAYTDKKQEYFLSLTLDGAGHLIETRVVTIGTLNQSLVHPREVFADAISDRAAGLIVAHNHPSGVLEPSHEDRRITLRLKEVGEIMGIELLDHVIFGKTGYLSLHEAGLV